MKFNADKFQFRVNKAKYMVLITFEKGVKPDEFCVRTINKLNNPINKKVVMLLLEMVNFYPNLFQMCQKLLHSLQIH